MEEFLGYIVLGMSGYFVLMSVIAFFIARRDKKAAGRGNRRTPERTLMLTGLLGGAVAMFATMRVIRHKTNRPKFMWGLPLMALVHLAVFGFFLVWWLVS